MNRKQRIEEKSWEKSDYTYFEYKDMSYYQNEMIEFMNFAEAAYLNESFRYDMNMFKKDCHNFNSITEDERCSIIRKLLNQLEMTDAYLRVNAAKCIFFIAQGCINHMVYVEGFDFFQGHDKLSAAKNTMLLLKLDVFSLFLELLDMEIFSNKYERAPILFRKPFTEYYNLYIILDVLYVIIEQVRNKKKLTLYPDKETNIFIADVLRCEEEDSLLFTLFEMMTSFVAGKSEFPIKKILLLIWKILVVTFGDLEDLYGEKIKNRVNAGLTIHHYKVPGKKSISPLPQKVSTKDLDSFMSNMRFKKKRIDSAVASESVESLKKHLYIPLSEIQLKDKRNHRRKETVDKLYKNLLPKMDLYIYCMIRLFHSCNQPSIIDDPTDFREPMNIFGEIHSQVPLISLEPHYICEHIEIINKAIMGIILTLLKILKLNHIYQFEFICQNLVTCNAIYTLSSYLEKTCDVFNRIQKLQRSANEHFDKFPVCKPSQRNLFTCVNALRILNKLIKRKYSLTRMFLENGFKYLFALTRLRNDTLTLYTLKLFKLASKLLGRKWRQDNMKIMNLVYQKCRNRLLDDWNPSSMNGEDESILANQLEFFNRQFESEDAGDFREITDSYAVELTDEFKKNYEKWLKYQVFDEPFDWNLILDCGVI